MTLSATLQSQGVPLFDADIDDFEPCAGGALMMASPSGVNPSGPLTSLEMPASARQGVRCMAGSESCWK